LDLRIGEKIKSLRLASDLTQTELADRAELTKGFISQLENDQTSIQIDSLANITEALGLTLAEFFSDVSVPVVFSPNERISVEGKGVKSFELLVAGSTNNTMDPILLRIAPGEQLEEVEPHPGEQFGFVLQGTATLKLGKKTFRIPKGHCFYFEADKSNQICNEGSSVAKILWVTTPPQM
jgi:transcriptional regulator with XRE-family HTH domain